MAVRSQEILEPFATESVLRKRHGFRAEGTARMIAGSLAGALGAYLFVVVGGRRLGTVQFAPIALLWTVFFIVATVVLIPLEQFVTREVGRGRRVLVADRRVLATVIGGTGIALAAFVALTNEALFGGHPIFILQAFLLTGLFGLMQVGKGILAGQRRFAAYGLVLTLEGVFRLPTPAAGFLGNYVIGSAASQLLLAGGPLGVVVLGGDAALRSVIFTTFTLYRAPLTLIYNLQGRVLSFLVRSNGNGVDVRRLITRIALIGVGLGSLAGLVGWLVGPALVELLFGPDFRPQAAVAALVAAGVIVASATQIMAQALVASGSTRQLAGAWVGGLLAGVAAMLVWGGGPGLRVGVGFLVGELTAFVLALIRTAGSR
jgi:O-antigen/teichoic acid export membrane protein